MVLASRQSVGIRSMPNLPRIKAGVPAAPRHVSRQRSLTGLLEFNNGLQTIPATIKATPLV